MNRRDLIKQTFAVVAGSKFPAKAHFSNSQTGMEPDGIASAEPGKEEIYKLLGFTTMTGEDPLKMWARLKNTRQWLAGPLSPDSWSGQVFIADDADIFAFRFLTIPAIWMSQDDRKGNRAQFCGGKFEDWFGGHFYSSGWPKWWRVIGPRAWDDSYAALVWQMPDGGPEVTYEWARTASNEVVCRITQSAPTDLLVQAYVPWDSAPPKFANIYSGAPNTRFLRGRTWVPGTRDGLRWVLATNLSPVEVSGVGTGRFHAFYPEVEKLYVCGRQGQQFEPLEEATSAWLAPGRIDDLLARNREKYEHSCPVGKGWLADVPRAINDQLEWSEVYTPDRRSRYITISRCWADKDNSAPDYHWDTLFNALLVCQEDERKCFDTVRDVTSWQNDQGMFCQFGQFWSRPTNGLIYPVGWANTAAPVGALIVAKIYLRRSNKQFLAEIYPRLLKGHRWWFKDRGDGQPWRDGNRNGLLELGSNYPDEVPYEDRQRVAYYESYDDSPQWWHVAKYNEKTGTIEQDPIERNCTYAMDCWALAWIADQLGYKEDVRALTAEHTRMKQTINRLLWNPQKACYFNRRWIDAVGDPFFPQMSPDIFLPMLGKVATLEQAEALRILFHDPTKFAGEWILPSISRDDPLYPKQQYWRGKVWPPMNWLVYQGLKIYDWDEEARLLAASSAKMFLKLWRERGECHENYLSTTGEGSSDPHYTWGTLLVLIAIEELIDANPWHGLRFGNVNPVEAGAIERYSIAGSLYDVSISSDHLEVRRDEHLLFRADRPVEIRHVEFEGDAVRFEVRSPKEFKLVLGNGRAQQFPHGLHKGSGTL